METVEIKEKIMAANRAFYANKKLLKSKNISKRSKVRIYDTIRRPILMYSVETMTMTKKNEENLRVLKRKILRSIMGPIKEAENEFRIRTNEELQRELNGKDIMHKKNKTTKNKMAWARMKVRRRIRNQIISRMETRWEKEKR
ncbi:transposase is4 [Holotrichia oblita]|uniref:Transposase is4 n=1 Tax=Holotrichia oblita TaxID=644536 RepID=A0ACB9T230_HOLOL|nr:transposase is4 [Holotrichia oblita]